MLGLKFHPFYKELTRHYAQLRLTSLQITAKLMSGVVTGVDQVVHLDGLLAWAVTAIYGAPTEKCTIPLPLECAWYSSQGLPLWVSTPFTVQNTTQSFSFWHKRFPQSQAITFCNKPNTSTSSGRSKEYRVPMLVQTPVDNLVDAYCIGNADEIAKLLSVVSAIGKKPGMGYGAVSNWNIMEVVISREEILSRRPVPAEWFTTYPDEMTVRLRGAWTPPYWDRTQHTKVIIQKPYSQS